MTTPLDYLDHLRTESARFLTLLRDADPRAPVPSCPDWTADDLLWHLAEVQWFWASVVRDAVTDPSAVVPPDRPADRAALVGFFEQASAGLQETLAATDPAAPRWTWSTEQTAGFTRRRQAHEALIHRVDAELATGAPRAPLDPALAADGVDEVLRVIRGGCPPWGRQDADPEATVRLVAADRGRSWLVSLARFTGTDPEGVSYDEDDLLVHDEDDDRRAALTVRGGAADLDCWLWRRPALGSVELTGDEEVGARLTAVLDQAIS